MSNTPKSADPLRLLLTWRPESAGDEAAQVAAWIARTETIALRTATVISRSWTAQPELEFDSYSEWIEKESEAVSSAAQKALALAKLPEQMLDADEPSTVTVDHSETKALIDAAAEFNADMMILGSHPAAPHSRFRIGSTADALLHYAPLPLLLAPRTPRL
uniref:universal stress protein n=1 Tax=uncultured Corynebacterium sp. TaxID=159447 RepID=UPI002605C27D